MDSKILGAVEEWINVGDLILVDKDALSEDHPARSFRRKLMRDKVASFFLSLLIHFIELCRS